MLKGLSPQELAHWSFLRKPGRSHDAPQADGAFSQVVRLSLNGDNPQLGDMACTIGAFDGIHRGHRFLFERTRIDARERGISSAIVTFDPDPDELFYPRERIRKILDNEDRVRLLSTFGLDYVVVVPFTRELAAHSTQDFMDRVLRSAMKPVSIHVGEDFRLGAGNDGSVSSLVELGVERGFVTHGHDLRCAGDQPVTATRIRDLISRGKLDEAYDLLCRPHFVRGEVQQGRHEGTGFGFPTANVKVTYPYVMPAEGVYAGFVEVDDMAYPAAVNVGLPASFTDELDGSFLEANLLGFSGDLYGRSVRVSFLEWLRPKRKFDDLSELIATVEANIDWVARNLGTRGVAL